MSAHRLDTNGKIGALFNCLALCIGAACILSNELCIAVMRIDFPLKCILHLRSQVCKAECNVRFNFNLSIYQLVFVLLEREAMSKLIHFCHPSKEAFHDALIICPLLPDNGMSRFVRLLFARTVDSSKDEFILYMLICDFCGIIRIKW